MTTEEIKNLECKKHVKIFLMHQLGIPSKDIQRALNTNAGHVYNVVKEYKGNEEKAAAANKMLQEANL